ncbi:NUDIX hydrolase [Bosea sp. 2KB_26]|uniref:NUDIX hydrolase n=1 Tax=Bosea sp. 2KB_26 TaxID=3237475 RepID=UPI003F933371
MKWRTLSSRTLLKDRWIDVRADECLTPTGHRVSPYYVLSYPDWVQTVAITPCDQLVLVRQYRHGAADTFLELPGGTMDEGDLDPGRSAARELEEETGYRAKELRLVSSLFANPATQPNRVHVYLATGAELTGSRKLDASEEGMSVHLMPVREILDRLHDGILKHSQHVSALLLALSVSGHLALGSPRSAPLNLSIR